MGVALLAVLSVLATVDFCSCQIQPFISWQTLRYKDLPGNAEYNASANVPFGATHHNGRIFISTPRTNPGIPAVLSVLQLTGNGPHKNPLLVPYPSLDMQSINSKNPKASTSKFISVYRTRIDRCGYLWFADTGVLEYAGSNRRVVQRPSIWAIDLNTDQVKWRHEFSEDVVKNDGAGLADITIDDDDCNNLFAYLPDVWNAALVVVDVKNSRSWRFNHNYFRCNPFEGEFNVDGFRFQWDDGIFSIALSNKNADGYKFAFFHPLAAHGEFAVSTKVLRNQALASRYYHGSDFKYIGFSSNRGNHVFDNKNRVIFFAEMQKNGISCWDPKKKDALKRSQVQIVAQNNQSMIYPVNINMDQESTLWVLSNRFPRVLYGNLDFNLFNFNVFKMNPNDIIRGTKCGRKVVADVGSGAGNEIGIDGDFQNNQPNFFQSGSFSFPISSKINSRYNDDDDDE